MGFWFLELSHYGVHGRCRPVAVMDFTGSDDCEVLICSAQSRQCVCCFLARALRCLQVKLPKVDCQPVYEAAAITRGRDVV